MNQYTQVGAATLTHDANGNLTYDGLWTYHYDEENRSWTAGGGWLCAVTATVALLLLMPLKRVEPFVIRVDTSTGLIDVVPQHTATGNVEEVITRYLLTHYVTICERFNFATAESDYQECGAFHTP